MTPKDASMRAAAITPRPQASLFDPGRNCWRARPVDRAAILVDAENYYRAFVSAAMRATSSIIILAWDFDSRTRLLCDEQEDAPPCALGPFLDYLVDRRPELHIYVLDWDFPMVYGTDREIPPPYGLGWIPRPRVHLRYDNTHPVAGSHHQKVVVIDDNVAFSGGLDLTNRRWDTCEHRGQDERRMCLGEPYPPFHDVMAIVDGDAARYLGELARERWLLATGEVIPWLGSGPDAWPEELAPEFRNTTVAISRTSPPTDSRSAVREVEELYLDMIASARDCIYIENQYFTSQKLARALEARLAEKDGPEVILVLRLLSHGWLEEHTMEVLRTQLILKLRKADKHRRFGVYYPHVPGLKEGTCVDVHSKVMVVDEEWFRVGSANMCNRSMGLDTECDLTMEAGGDAKIMRVIGGLRNRLLAEHLNASPERIAEARKKTGSMVRAIESLQGGERTLKSLGEMKEWTDTAIEMAALADPDKPVSIEVLMEHISAPVKTEPKPRRWRTLLIAVAVIAGLAALWRYTPLSQFATAERVVSLAENFSGLWWAPLLVIAAYTPACLTMFPRPLITLFAIVAFGPLVAAAYAMAGILLAAAVTYWMGTWLNPATVRRVAGEKLVRISEMLRERGLLAVTALRLVPIAPFSVEGLVAGAIRIKLWHFMFGTFLGTLPGTFATTVFGQQISAGLRNSGEINYWVIGGVVLLLAVGTWLVKRWLFNAKPESRTRKTIKRTRNGKVSPA
jgi:phospholipase D1/2